jgi:hypothetical protein
MLPSHCFSSCYSTRFQYITAENLDFKKPNVSSGLFTKTKNPRELIVPLSFCRQKTNFKKYHEYSQKSKLRRSKSAKIILGTSTSYSVRCDYWIDNSEFAWITTEILIMSYLWYTKFETLMFHGVYIQRPESEWINHHFYSPLKIFEK